MRKSWITWEEYSKGYTQEDYLADALKGCLPTIDGRDATYQELADRYQETIDRIAEIKAMRKSAKKERLLDNAMWRFQCLAFSMSS